MRKWVIVKTSRDYRGGPGYSGPSCEAVGIDPGHIYYSEYNALRDCMLLSAYNPVGFWVAPYRERDT